MSEFFNDKRFLNKINNLTYGKERIIDIMKEIKEKNPDLSINVFICILDKKKEPSLSSMEFGAGLYQYSVELWNQYIFNNCKCDFDLLINYKDICF